MRAVAVFPSKHEVGLIDHPEPKITEPRQAKMRVLEVGVCGTDREITSYQYGTPPAGFDYLVIGHESLSEVVEVGAEVSRVKPGDLVVMTVRRPCAHSWCMACRDRRQDFCYSGDFTERGIKQQHGYMTEFVVEDEQYLSVVPRALRDVAVLVEPLTIAEKSLEQLWTIQQRLPWNCPDAPGKASGHCHRAVVLGAGPVGLLGAMALRVSGFEVTVYSRSPSHQESNDLVSKIGARYMASETHTMDDLANAAGPIDVIYEATGASSVAFDAVHTLGPNGVFIFTGVPGLKGPNQVETDRIMRDMVLNNQAVVGSVNAPPQAFRAAIEHLGAFVERWPDAIRSVITARFPLERALEPLTGHGGGVKNVIQVAS